jgi:transcription initiation factor TFIIE subunit alpha
MLKKIEYEDTFVKIANLLGGDDYIRVARALLNNEDTTDEEIASATGLKINTVRKVLYDLFSKALISGIRVRDEKKGWFVYRWRVKRDNVDTFIDLQRRKILERLKIRLNYEESNQFYHCGNDSCQRLTFDQAYEVFFRCPSCKMPLNPVDNTPLKQALMAKIKELSDELKSSSNNSNSNNINNSSNNSSSNAGEVKQ